MTSHSSIGHSKPNQTHQQQSSTRQYQRSFSEDLEPSKILESGETNCCPTDAPTIAQALWRPLWPPGWRPRSSSTNKCTNQRTSTNFSSKRSTSSSNQFNLRSDFNSITGTTGNTLKNIFKRPLIIMSEHREDHRSSGPPGLSVNDIIKSKTGTQGKEGDDEGGGGGKRGVPGVDGCVLSGKLGGAGGGESEHLLGNSVSENFSGNSAFNASSSKQESYFNCVHNQQSKTQSKSQNCTTISSQLPPPPLSTTQVPSNNRLITLSTGRLRLGPTSNDVSSSLEEYESMEAWLDEHPKFLCDYVIRKAPRSTIDAWILAHSIPHSAGSSCGTSSASAPASGAATPVRKISAHEFEKGSLFLPPMVSTTEEGIPTFLQPPTRDDYHPSSSSSSYHSSCNQNSHNLHHNNNHYPHHQQHQHQQYFSSNLSTTEYSYLSSSSLGPSLTLRQPQLTSSSSTTSSTSSSSAPAAASTAGVAAALQAIISSSSLSTTTTITSSSPLTDISSPSSSVQRSRSQFDGLDEKQLIFELVKDICNDLDVVSLNHKILKNVSLLTNADRCSLFLVKGEPGDPNRHFVPTLFDVSSKQGPTTATTTTGQATTTPNASIKLESIKVPWGQGIVGYVAESGESVIIDDCYKDSRFSDLVDQMTGFKTRNMLCSPIFDNYGQVMGVAQVINKLPRSRLSIPSVANSLTINNQNNNTNTSSISSNNNGNNSNNNVSGNNNCNNLTSVSFTLDDQRIFNQYLQFCGIGLRNAQLFERSQLENKRNQVLLDLARMVFEEQSTIDQIVYRIMVHIQSLLGCERCQVLLVSESSSSSCSHDDSHFDSCNEVDMVETDSIEPHSGKHYHHYHHHHQQQQQLEVPIDNSNWRGDDNGSFGESNDRTFSRVFDLSIDDLKDEDEVNDEHADDNNNSPREDKNHGDSKMNEISSTTTNINSSTSQLPSSPGAPSMSNHPFEGRFPINIGITGYVAATGETLNIPNAYEDTRFDTSVDSLYPRGFVHKSILCMPIRNANRRIIGVSQLINKLNGQPFNKNDENLFEAFAIFCGMGIHNTQMYEKAMKAMAKQRVTFECLSYHATSRREEAIALSREPIPSTQALRLACLDFHDFSLETDDKMVKACIRMFLDLDLINRFSIDYLTLCRWLLSVRKNYRPVTYHNWRHAFNVAQMMFAILVSTSLCNSLGELDTLALIMACLCHDLDHRGTNNSFQIKSSSPLATLYSTSTMEHHHFDQSLMILNSEGNQILSNLSPAEYKRVVRVMEEAILATDLVVYFTNRESFVRLIESGDYHWDSNESDKQLLRGMLMTACDIAAITKPWEVQKVVAELVATEFFQQGDIEKEKLNLQPIDMMNREKKDELPRLQVSFIDSICLPIYSAFSSLYPDSLSQLRQGVITNKHNWLYQALAHPSLKDWAIEELEKMEKSDQSPLTGHHAIDSN